MKKKMKKLVAALLMLSMTASMLGTTAFAADVPVVDSSSQIVYAGGTTTGDNVTIRKTISGTDQENVFDIILDVTTTEDLGGNTVTTAPDAAVSLVVDVSRTMAFKYINGSSCQEKDLNSRLNVAKRVMLSFLDDYAASGKDESGNQIAHRWVNLVGFGGQAWNYLYGHGSWVDVATDEGMAVLKSILSPVTASQVGKKTTGAVLGSGNKYLDWSGTIASEKIDWTNGHGNGGTNIEAGLMLANNIWAAGGKVADIPQEYSWTVMLSDGEPTMYVDPNNSVTKKADNGNGVNSTAFIYGLNASSSATINKTDYVDVPAEAADIRARSNFEIVAMGNDKWMNSKAKWDLVNNTTCGAWLKTLSTSKTINTPGSTEADLAAAFSGISGTISRQLSFMSNEAWKVTDPMGANIEFLGFHGADGLVNTLAGQYAEGAEDSATVDENGTINWDLKSSGYTKEGSSTGFSIKYRVRLTTEAEGFVFGQAYNANGDAALQYQTVTSTGYSALKTLAFEKPTVKGLTADLSFLKTDAKGNALNGAAFTLVHASDCICGKTLATTGTYAANGNCHSFAGIPSAHTYTLLETTTPEGYVNEEGNRTITISMGQVIDVAPVFNVNEEGNWYIENTSKEDILDGEKTSTLIDRVENRWEIEVKIPAPGEITSHDEVIVMVDGSYSGDKVWPQTREAILEIGEAVLNGTGKTQFTLMTFGMSDNIVVSDIKSVEQLDKELTELPGGLLYGRSSTNCEAGFTGIQEYIAEQGDDLDSAYVIYISDGGINTDETPFTYGAFDTYTWLPNRFGDAATLLKMALEAAIYSGGDAQATKDIFGSNDAAKDAFDAYMDAADALAAEETTMTEAELAEATEIVSTFDANVAAWGAKVFEYAYAPAHLTVGEAYPISVVEDAFVDYDNENDTYIQDVFYYTAYGRGYPDRWSRTPAAATALAADPKVAHLYMVDNNAASSWMNPDASEDPNVSVQGENVSFTYNANVTGLSVALESILAEVAKTPINDVYVTDYMSKWANLDPDTIKIVDNNSGETIWTVADGWLIDENIPTAKNPPVVVELVDPADYAAGGDDVEGNVSGDIYKLTWYVKDGALLRSDNYSMIYEVITDVEEKEFEYKVSLPANGNTDVNYKDGDGDDQKRPIEVPDIDGVDTEIKYYDEPYFTAADENGEPTDDLITDPAKSIEDGDITMNHTIEQIEAYKNGYEVTLEVTSKVDLSTIEISPDAAVVLVIDTSGSMQYDMDGYGYCINSSCGNYQKYNKSCNWTHRWAIHPETGENTTRYKLAADGLNAFLNDYEDGTEGKRMVSIVYFGESAELKQGWINLNEEGNLDTALSKVTYDALSARPRTNTAQGTGLAMAGDLLNDELVKDIDNRYVILLTDGRPENDPVGDADAKANETGAHGTAMAEELESEYNTTVQVIACGTNAITMKQATSTGYTYCNDWLKYDVATTTEDFYSAQNFDELRYGLGKFSQKITDGVSLYTVEAPMADYINFDGLVTESAAANFVAKDNKLTWDLLKETPEIVEEDGSVTYKYTLTYKVLLDVEGDGFKWDTLYPVNSSTKLTYVELNEDGSIDPDAEIETAWFNIPGVYAEKTEVE